MGLRFCFSKEYNGEWVVLDEPVWDIEKIKGEFLKIVWGNLPSKEEYLNVIKAGLPDKMIKRYTADEIMKLVGETWDEMNKKISEVAGESWDDLVKSFKKESINVR